ncbi:phosphoglucomutase/phosphomannomutase family protein [Elusimicrobiota bacterium]
MIKFGTSGWRGLIADDFTFDNVRLVTQAICKYLKTGSKKKDSGVIKIIVGYDTRFLSEKFAEICAQVLAANGIKALICDRNTPTPVVSFEILRRKLEGGINFTASHNPYNYNGLKFSPSWGGPALPKTTKAIEKYCKTLKQKDIKSISLDDAKAKNLIEYIDPAPLYLKRIKELIDFNAIKNSGIKIAVDLLNGTAAGYLDKLLNDAGISNKVVRINRDVMFGGGAPEPSKENLKDFVDIMKKESCTLGLATDGDADRFGIVDSDGTFINPNQVVSVLLYHLIKSRKWKGIVARSVMTTHMVDKIADKFGLEVRETPVGFKFIASIMVEAKEKFVIGGEESGGLTIRNHIPEKDGILACLLMAEMVAMNNKSIKTTLKEIEGLVGEIYSERINFKLTTKGIEKFRLKLKKKILKSFGEYKIKKTVTLDGYKFILQDNSWIGIRFSGTEPIVRLYIESDSSEKAKKLIQLGKEFIV